MDGIANVAKIQQTQLDTTDKQTRVQETTQTQNRLNQGQEEEKNKKINSQGDMDSLISKLNETVSLMNQDVKFGVDQDNIFYVSVIDTKENRVIHRFPAEKAAEFLPKMKEVTGILFDSKG